MTVGSATRPSSCRPLAGLSRRRTSDEDVFLLSKIGRALQTLRNAPAHRLVAFTPLRTNGEYAYRFQRISGNLLVRMDGSFFLRAPPPSFFSITVDQILSFSKSLDPLNLSFASSQSLILVLRRSLPVSCTCVSSPVVDPVFERLQQEHIICVLASKTDSVLSF